MVRTCLYLQGRAQKMTRAACACAFASLLSATAVRALTIEPTDMTGLRNDFGSQTVELLTFSAVHMSKPEFEDRTILHFDIAGLTTVAPGSTLNIPIDDFSGGPPPGVL